MDTRTRWIAEIDYRTDIGTIMVEHHLSELAELQDRVERGPHWDTIEAIRITRNPNEIVFRGTVEEAERL